MDQLTALRCERMKPLFPYMARTIELERERIAAGARLDSSGLVELLRKLDEMIADLPKDYQAAIQEAFQHEAKLLLLACMPQAAAVRFLGHTTSRA